MKAIVFLTILSSLLYLWKVSSQTTTTNSNNFLLQCLKNQTNPPADISHILYTPSNPAFPSILRARIQNLRFTAPKTSKPKYLITPTKKSHISAVVICTKNLGLRLIVRSGGHDFDGLSYISDVPFVILDMVNFRTIQVDVATKTAYVEAGATLGEFYYRIWEKSKVLGFPAGVCPTVGIGGHLSGGGYGNMMRKYGLSVDQIIDAELVDVNGRILDRKSMGEDLFWAIRGGGGASFGVVLSYTVNLVQVPEKVTVFNVMRFEKDNVTDLVDKWQNIMQDIDEDLFIRLYLQPIYVPKSGGGSGKRVIRVTFISLFLGSAEELISVMNSGFPELGLQKNDCFEMSWAESVLFWYNYDVGTPVDVLLNRTYDANYLKRKSDYVMEPISKDRLELLWKKLAELGKPGLVFNSYGGKMKEIQTTDTPFPHRNGIFYKIQYSINWNEPGHEEDSTNLALIRQLYDFMTPYVSKSPRRAYLNYRDIDIGVNDHNFSYEASKVFGQKYFAGNFDRLVQIKSKVDPDNFFKYEQSITPLTSSSWQKKRLVYIIYFVNAFATWFFLW